MKNPSSWCLQKIVRFFQVLITRTHRLYERGGNVDMGSVPTQRKVCAYWPCKTFSPLMEQLSETNIRGIYIKTIAGIIVIITALGVGAWAAEKITEAQLPAAVQKTLNQQKGTDTVKEIQKETRNGQP